MARTIFDRYFSTTTRKKGKELINIPPKVFHANRQASTQEVDEAVVGEEEKKKRTNYTIIKQRKKNKYIYKKK